jgi:hypothetical protein
MSERTIIIRGELTEDELASVIDLLHIWIKPSQSGSSNTWCCAEKAELIRQHPPYELDMLNITLERITRVTPTTTHSAIPEWNAYFESFAVHARNLRDFLTNDGDSRNFQAKDFVDRYRASDKNKTSGMFQDLDSPPWQL